MNMLKKSFDRSTRIDLRTIIECDTNLIGILTQPRPASQTDSLASIQQAWNADNKTDLMLALYLNDAFVNFEQT